ncbi:MAG: 5'-3' exonuclease [Solirubrobacteraceae bacterium]
MRTRAPLLIADVPWLLYRGFFSVPKSVRGADGRAVNALLGALNALLAAIEAESPRAVLACFGAEQARYRVELYGAYHAHRDPMPQELAHQWPLAADLLASFGWTVFDAGELEADDAIGAFAAVERDGGGQALLLTGDRDLHQVVSEEVAVLELKGDGPARVEPAAVRERVGVDPSRVPDLIALRGDPSDGLPGARGVGAKTAASLLHDHGTLEGVLAAAAADDARMSARIAATLRESAEQLRDFKRIATLAPIEVQRPPDRATDWSSGAAAAAELGMVRLADRLTRLATA